MKENLSGKKNLIIILIIALGGFLLLSLGSDDNVVDEIPLASSTAAEVLEMTDSEVVEEGVVEDSPVTSAPDEATETTEDTEVGEPLGTGGGIIGYDEEKWPIYGDVDTETQAIPEGATVTNDTSVASTGATLLQDLSTINADTFEIIRPDLLRLIEALEDLIVDLEGYIAYRQTL